MKKICKMKIYKFKKYEKVFPTLYNNETKKIRKIVPKNSLLEHVDSTAVPGLRGKGIIDLMIYSSKNGVNEIKTNLEKMGYEEGSSDKNRIFLRRDSKINSKNRRFHIHIISIGKVGGAWVSSLGTSGLYPKSSS